MSILGNVHIGVSSYEIQITHLINTVRRVANNVFKGNRIVFDDETMLKYELNTFRGYVYDLNATKQYIAASIYQALQEDPVTKNRFAYNDEFVTHKMYDMQIVIFQTYGMTIIQLPNGYLDYCRNKIKNLKNEKRRGK